MKLRVVLVHAFVLFCWLTNPSISSGEELAGASPSSLAAQVSTDSKIESELAPIAFENPESKLASIEFIENRQTIPLNYDGDSQMRGGEDGPPPSTCSLAPVRSLTASFTPVRVFGAMENYLTGVSSGGVIVGNYLEPATSQFRPFRAQSRKFGGYTGLAALSKGGYQRALGLGVSDDGSTFVGSVCPSGGCNCAPGSPFEQCRLRAVRWSSPTAEPQKLSRLGAPTGGCQDPIIPCDFEAIQSEAVAANSSGSIAAGSFIRGTYLGSGVRWSGSGAATPTAINPPPASCFPPNFCISWGRGLSSTGSVVVGVYVDFSTGGFNPFRWNSGQSAAVPLAALQGSNPAIARRDAARGLSPEGIFVVGKGLNGTQVPWGTVPSIIPAVDPNNRIPTSDVYQVDEAAYWQQSVSLPTKLGDLNDLPNSSGNTLFDSRMNDATSCGARMVGNSYGGGEANVPLSEFFRTAVIYPSLAGSRTITRIKPDLLSNHQLNIDANNPFIPNTSERYRWQLIDATAISADGKKIVGSAICHGGVDSIVYGFIVRLDTPTYIPSTASPSGLLQSEMQWDDQAIASCTSFIPYNHSD